MLEKLKKASPNELELWMTSAVVLGFGVGMLVSDYIKSYAIWITLIGLATHLWAMYRIYLQK